MEYRNIINLLDITPNQLSQFRTKNCVEINDDSRKTYNTNSSCDDSDAYILVKGTISVANTVVQGAEAHSTIIK